MAEKEYIEREAVLADELTHCLPYSAGKAAGRVVVFAEDIEAIPAADVAPVRHGRWVHDTNNLYGCSECLGRETMSHKKLKNFCPNCGAKMELGGG